MNRQYRIPIGVKVFGIAASMLGLLLLVVVVSSHRLRQLNQEIDMLAAYTIPITDLVAKTNVQALEQEIHVERLLRFSAMEPPNVASAQAEQSLFEERSQRVDALLQQAADLGHEAIVRATRQALRQELTSLEPMLAKIAAAHRTFHDRALYIIRLAEAGKLEQVRQLEAGLDVEGALLDHHIEAIFLTLEKFTVQAAGLGQHHLEEVQYLCVLVALVATLFGTLCACLVTLGLIRPVRRLVHSMQTIEQGNLETQVEIHTRDEMAALSRSFNHMVGELKLKATLEDTFGKYLDPRIVKTLLTRSTDANTAGERQVMTVFFADVEGFGTGVASLTPDRLVTVTNQYLNVMSGPISAHAGVIDKFIDHMVMGFWGPPFTRADEHASLACETAMEQLERLDHVYALIKDVSEAAQPFPELRLHVGIATGPLVAGTMGSATTKSYTVMGDTVNIASRLKGVSKQYGIAIAITQETHAVVSNHFEARELDVIRVVGKEEPIRVYELLGRQGEVSATTLACRDSFEQGLLAYRQRDWAVAERCFAACVQHKRHDPPAELYLQRLVTLRETPPPHDWDGVWDLTHK